MAWSAHWEELCRHDQWNIGVIAAPLPTLIEAPWPPPVQWLPTPSRNRFHADPFGVETPTGLQILCEEWDAARDRGRLVALHPDGSSEPLQGFPPVHLSYPYVVSEGGDCFCLPEHWQAGAVRLYRARRFPLDWVCDATLLPGFAGVDPTVFRYEERWWMAVTHQFHQPDAALFLWYADALHGPWLPHARNPVKVDLRTARPAGTPFLHNGGLYRPAQDCSRCYGGAVSLQRVLRLNPREFVEEPAVHWEPASAWLWSAGLHTIAGAGGYTLIDAKRVVLMPRAFLRVLGRKASRFAWDRRDA